MWVALYIVFGRVCLAEAQKIWPKIFANSCRPNQEHISFFQKKNSSYLPDSSGAFHFNLLPGFPPYFEMIWSHLWYIFKQSEPKVSQALQHPHLCIWPASNHSHWAVRICAFCEVIWSSQYRGTRTKEEKEDWTYYRRMISVMGWHRDVMETSFLGVVSRILGYIK